MSAPSDRQRKIEVNRSLRTIKNELESLLEKGIITDETFDSIHTLLPAEGTLGAAATFPAALPTPASTAPPSPPVNPIANLNLNTNRSASPAAAPPTYAQSTGSSNAGPPTLPERRGPPPPPAAKPVLCHARALYRYAAGDARDCNFEPSDRIAVLEYMNSDWWMGRNLRTGREGIFPKTYVEPEVDASSPAPAAGGWNNEKAAPWQGPPQPMYAQQGGPGGYPAAPPQGVPYNSAAPPQGAPDQGGAGGGKMGEHGKKFGKKLGNAAIFGAGATIGSNIVNSIF